MGAVRLPDNTFRANAGTEVTSDILILQKRDRIIDIEPEWVHLDTDENGVTMNSYFVSHSEMVLGEMKMESTRFGMDSACKAYPNVPLAGLLHEAIQFACLQKLKKRSLITVDEYEAIKKRLMRDYNVVTNLAA